MTEYVNHDGRDFPLIPYGTIIEVVFRDGQIQRDYHRNWGYWLWDENMPEDDVIRYRIID